MPILKNQLHQLRMKLIRRRIERGRPIDMGSLSPDDLEELQLFDFFVIDGWNPKTNETYLLGYWPTEEATKEYYWNPETNIMRDFAKICHVPAGCILYITGSYYSLPQNENRQSNQRMKDARDDGCVYCFSLSRGDGKPTKSKIPTEEEIAKEKILYRIVGSSIGFLVSVFVIIAATLLLPH